MRFFTNRILSEGGGAPAGANLSYGTGVPVGTAVLAVMYFAAA